MSARDAGHIDVMKLLVNRGAEDAGGAEDDAP